jgi:cytochrome c oxidase subunit IV
MNTLLQNNPEAIKAYNEYERETNLRHLHMGCWLVILLMPAGLMVDYFVYPGLLPEFLKLRFIASGCGVLVLLLLHSQQRERFHFLLCLLVALIPAFFMCWMIKAADGAK